LILVVAAYIGLRLWHIRSYSLWGGESYGLALARRSWQSMFHYAVMDVAHPPLFYCLFKIWIALRGDGILWLKLLPVLFSIATIVPFILLSRELRLSRGATNLALLLAACNGFLIHYAQEVRSYSLLLLLAVTSAWLFVRFFNAGRDVLWKGVALSVVNLLLVYTHYHGWVLVAAEGLFLLIWGRHRLAAFAVSVAAVAIAFAPWAFLVARAALSRKMIGSEWVPRPGLPDLKLVYENLNGRPFPTVPGGALAGVLLFAVPVLVWAWKTVGRRPAAEGDQGMVLWLLVLLGAFPVAALFLTSQVSRQSLFLDRYLIFMTLRITCWSPPLFTASSPLGSAPPMSPSWSSGASSPVSAMSEPTAWPGKERRWAAGLPGFPWRNAWSRLSLLPEARCPSTTSRFLPRG
jgi:hypothetical protein